MQASGTPLLPDYKIIPENYEQDNLNLIKTIDSLNTALNKLKPFLHIETGICLLPFALRQAQLAANKNLLGIKLKNYIEAETFKGHQLV